MQALWWQNSLRRALFQEISSSLEGVSSKTCISRTHNPFDLVHSDVWGPAPFASKGGHRFMLYLLMTTLAIHGFTL